MADFTVKKVDDMQAAYGGAFVKARAELGVTSFGIQVIRLPPQHDRVPRARPHGGWPGGGLPGTQRVRLA